MLKTLDPAYIADRLAGAAGEARNLEFKAGFSWELKNMSWIQAKTIKAILGLTNTRYGGTVIIGIHDNARSGFTYDGVTGDMVKSFGVYEQVQQHLDSFADGPMIYEMGVGEYDSKTYIVVNVSEFEEFPVLCAKDFQHGGKPLLTKGDMYVRSKRAKPATIKATNAELREIVQMAHRKNRTAIMELVGGLGDTGSAVSLRGRHNYAPYEQMDQDL